MIHLTQCRYTAAYWNAVILFLYKTLKIPHEQYTQTLIILNISRGKLVSTEACAFIRHVFAAFYRDFAMVDTHGKPFIWRKTFNQTMTTYKEATTSWAMTAHIFHTNRQNTSRKQHIPQATLRQFPTLVTFNDDNYTFTLTADFRAAIDDATNAAATL